MRLNTCVTPDGRFRWGVHRPRYRVDNLRWTDELAPLGETASGAVVDNRVNFPAGQIEEDGADWIYEILNPFPFRGATYIKRRWAEGKARDPSLIELPTAPAVSMSEWCKHWWTGIEAKQRQEAIASLPEPILLALAATATDPEDLSLLSRQSAEFVMAGEERRPLGLKYRRDEWGQPQPIIGKPVLFEVLANNPYLPDSFKEVMVLRPGVQGSSEIVGEWGRPGERSHVFEYLRRNSYIPWGHYAANLANDSIRYRLEDLSLTDMTGLRHLYYQRTYFRLAEQLGIAPMISRRRLSFEELEILRLRTMDRLANADARAALSFNRTLWGWNFGFDYAPSQYRLHASHQQIHQQYALVPSRFLENMGVALSRDEFNPPVFAADEPIAAFCDEFRRQTGRPFFESYLAAIRSNTRTDGDQRTDSRLIVYEADGILVFVPKAQTAQWELQLMTAKPIGNVLEADRSTRAALDRALLVAARILSALGARMITSIEYSKGVDSPDTDQRLMYVLLPKMPESPGAFSEAQLRFINGHYPEDFARACRLRLAEVLAAVDEG